MVETDADFVKTGSIGEYMISSNYLPAEYMALSEVRASLNDKSKVSKEQFKEKEAQFKNSLYFRVKISRVDKKDILQELSQEAQRYSQLLNHLTFNMAEAFYLRWSDKDSVRCLHYSYQRSYGLSPDASFIVAFPRPGDASDISLKCFPRVLGITKSVEFPYSSKIINEKYSSFNEIN